MKKTLIIVRHAHTNDPKPGQDDHERELTSEGNVQARHSAEWLKEQGSLPKTIMASSAVRTRATAAIFAEVLLGDAGAVQVEPALFRAHEPEVLDLIHQNFTTEGSIMIVGHNPTVTQLAIRLGATSVSYLPPASVIVLSFEIPSWEDLQFHQGKVIAKNITDED
ncbi:MAG TPA: histidine phosphatase family protein [Adhaeribacter sp.]|nr:histidine phosphatase family protein [Adhaeribacter sp.]